MENQTYQPDDPNAGVICPDIVTAEPSGEEALLITAYNEALHTESAATFQNLNITENPQASPGKVQTFCEEHCSLFNNIFHKYFCSSITECVACVATTVSLVIPAVMLPIGVVYRERCPVQPWIPLYLIIGGSAALVFIAFPLLVKAYMCQCSSAAVKRCFYYVSRIVLAVSVIAQIAWWIAGGYWVFSVYHVYQSIDHSRDDYCPGVLYTFCFWFLLISYITIPSTMAIFFYLVYVKKLIKFPSAHHNGQQDETEEYEPT